MQSFILLWNLQELAIKAIHASEIISTPWKRTYENKNFDVTFGIRIIESALTDSILTIPPKERGNIKVVKWSGLFFLLILKVLLGVCVCTIPYFQFFFNSPVIILFLYFKPRSLFGYSTQERSIWSDFSQPFTQSSDVLISKC